MMTHLLLIWNEFDLGLRTFVIPMMALTKEQLAVFELARDQYLNASDTTNEQENALKIIYAGITKNKEHVESKYHHHHKKWVQYECNEISGRLIAKMVRAGFVP